MTPARAQELWDMRGIAWCIPHKDQRPGGITTEEDKYVKMVWRTMGGSYCWFNAFHAIRQGGVINKNTEAKLINRCDKCEACKCVRATAALVMPNPPFEHADQATVDMWNKTLDENPCTHDGGQLEKNRCDKKLD